MSAQYRHADAREGIRELAYELGRGRNQGKLSDVLFFVHSMKRIHLFVPGCEPPRGVLIRPFNEFTLGYTTQIPFNDPAFDNHVEVVRTEDEQLNFLENGHLLGVSEFASKLIRLVAAEAEPA